MQRQRKQKARANYHTYRALGTIPTRYTPLFWKTFTKEQQQEWYEKHRSTRMAWYDKNKAITMLRATCHRQVKAGITKYCNDCHKTLAKAMFDVKSYSKSTGKPYLRPYCRDCRKKINKDTYANNNQPKQPTKRNPINGQFISVSADDD